MADGYGFITHRHDVRSVRDEDFDEEDVWAVVKERKDTSPKIRISKDSSISAPRRLPTASRMIPRVTTAAEVRVHQQSAPVNIPDWSKIYIKTGSESPYLRDGSWAGDVDVHDEDDDGDKDDDDDDWVPPHEWIAKKLERNQISSFSVCEGAGRTLKGRDLSKVRNAILTRTGFLE